MAEESSHVSVIDVNDVKRIEFSDRKILDELVINEIMAELVAVVDSVDRIKMLLDFEKVDHLSSAALGMLITLNKRVSEADGQLRLAKISPQIFEVFKITRLDKLFDIRSTVEEAMGSF